MTDTLGSFEIPGTWTDLNDLTGIAAGTELIVQNIGIYGDVISCFVSEIAPIQSIRGVDFDQIKQLWRVSASVNQRVFVRVYRLDRPDLGEHKGRLQVQAAFESLINIVDAIPPDIFTGAVPNARRLKVSTATRQELQIVRGTFFVGNSIRLGVSVADVHFSILKAGPDKFLVIEDAIVAIGTADVADGRYTVRLDGYVDISDRNSWDYTPNVPNQFPVGSPLNAALINDRPTSIVEIGAQIDDLLGVPDYPFFFEDHHIATQGNSESISSTKADFFKKGRQVILSPKQELLIVTTTAGDIGGTADIRTIFFTSELSASEVPTL